MNDLTGVIEQLKSRFGERSWDYSEYHQNKRLVVAAEQCYAVLGFLKKTCGFDMAIDVTCVDYLHYRGAKNRFGMVYNLLNTVTGQRLIVRAYLNEPELKIPSVVEMDSMWNNGVEVEP